MKRAHIVAWLVAGATVAGGLVVGCTYAPNFRDGALKCSPDGQCPRGYTCVSDLCCLPGDPTCGGTIGPGDASMPADGSTSHFEVRPDAVGTGGVTAAGTGGTSGAAGHPATSVSAYVGVWTLSPAATVTTVCGSPAPFNETDTFTPDDKGNYSTITILDNGDGTLSAEWELFMGCPYQLSIDSTGAHGIDADTWGCQALRTQPTDPDQTWIYDSFDIVTVDGLSGVHDADYNREDDYSDGTSVLCQQTVHAALTKN